ncbi:MAG TPA: AbrB/MazE/SpoVT family DNA-binding domain-containing protein [Phycisphaerae bacterium]|nr:AbrB/MazE/SpoVT family DNA-binding domain-containing protein [Phycisphaerae bacterium]
MRITAKGQVTIPKEVRHRMGLLPGCEVEFVEDGRRVYIRKAEGPTRGERLVARMRGRGDVRMSTDEILTLTRGRT